MRSPITPMLNELTAFQLTRLISQAKEQLLSLEGQRKTGTETTDFVTNLAAKSLKPNLVIFSGGTAYNAMVQATSRWTDSVAYIMPVSDDGGSTAEVLRVLGGPAVGDIRSRCLRLSDTSSVEAMAVQNLLGHRLSHQAERAKQEWLHIVEGRGPLWQGMTAPYKATVRCFLVYFQQEVMRQNATFIFANGSIGNFFFAGARLFFRSLDAAIFLYSRVSGLSPDSLVLPITSTNDTLCIGAELTDGSMVRGQSAISHPNVNGTNSTFVNKQELQKPLPFPIRRIMYLSRESTYQAINEVFPVVNERVLTRLQACDAIIYGIGSLYTSICPGLILQDVGEAISARRCPKVLVLNGRHDRETFGMTAHDVVRTVTDHLNRSHSYRNFHSVLSFPSSAYVTALVCPEGGDFVVDRAQLTLLGVHLVLTVPAVGGMFEPETMVRAIQTACMRSPL